MNPFIPARRVLLALFALLICTGLASAQDHHLMVRLWIDTEADQAFFDQWQPSLDVATGRRGEFYDVVVARPDLDQVLSTWQDGGRRAEVRQPDLEAFYAARNGNRDNFGTYHTYSENLTWMDDLHAQYPQVVSARWSLGQTYNLNDVWCLRVSDNPDVDEPDEPQILFDALHHAREVMSSEMVMMLAEYLAQQYQAGDAEIVDLVDNTAIYLVPMVNPDGFLYNEQTYPDGGGMWRKNRRNNGDGTYGVDNNRNYPYEWGCAGSSGIPGDELYRGPSPGSEPETQAMMNFVNSHDLVVRQSFHTYSNLTMYPWGYTSDDTDDEAIFREMAAAMVQFNGYTPGQPPDVLYEVCGGSIDWDYGQQDEHTKIYSFSTEIGGSLDGFWPSDARRQPLFDENLWPSLYLIQMTRTLRGVTFTHTPLPYTSQATGNYSLTAVATGFEGTAIDDGSVSLHYSVDGGAFIDVALAPTGNPNEYGGNLPAQAEDAVVDYYLSAVDVDGRPGTSPRGAPDVLHHFEVGTDFTHDMEADRGWTAGDVGDDATTGLWVRVDPVGTSAQPEDDHSPDGTMCWITGQQEVGQTDGFNDVDGGTTSLLSPIYDVAGAESVPCSYWVWYSNDQGNNPGTDTWLVQASNDAGVTWQTLESTMASTNAWVQRSYDLVDLFPQPAQVRLRFRASDLSPGSLVEAGIDDVHLAALFGATDTPSPLAMKVTLAQNAPNPFNPRTVIRFTLPAAMRTELGIYDVQGRLVRSLVTGGQTAGDHAVTWNGADALGRPVASGVYLCTLRAEDGTVQTRRLALMK